MVARWLRSLAYCLPSIGRRLQSHLLRSRAQGHAKPHEYDADQGQRVGGRKGCQQQHKEGDVKAPLLQAAEGGVNILPGLYAFHLLPSGTPSLARCWVPSVGNAHRPAGLSPVLHRKAQQPPLPLWSAARTSRQCTATRHSQLLLLLPRGSVLFACWPVHCSQGLGCGMLRLGQKQSQRLV